jgi:chaperonin cofactor prefoldin
MYLSYHGFEYNIINLKGAFNMIDKIEARLEQLSQEASILMVQRDGHQKSIQEIETKLNEISKIIIEMHKLLGDIDEIR